MSATQTMYLIDQLVKAKIPKKTAAELIDYVEKRKDKSIDRLWIALLTGFAITITLTVSIPFYLHSDTKTDMQSIKTDMQIMKTEHNARLDRMESRNIERHKELKQLIRKK